MLSVCVCVYECCRRALWNSVLPTDTENEYKIWITANAPLLRCCRRPGRARESCRRSVSYFIKYRRPRCYCNIIIITLSVLLALCIFPRTALFGRTHPRLPRGYTGKKSRTRILYDYYKHLFPWDTHRYRFPSIYLMNVGSYSLGENINLFRPVTLL